MAFSVAFSALHWKAVSGNDAGKGMIPMFQTSWCSPTGRADGPRKVKSCQGLHSSVDFQPFPGMFQGPSKASGP